MWGLLLNMSIDVNMSIDDRAPGTWREGVPNYSVMTVARDDRVTGT